METCMLACRHEGTEVWGRGGMKELRRGGMETCIPACGHGGNSKRKPAQRGLKGVCDGFEGLEVVGGPG
jgi:hypothetical protein